MTTITVAGSNPKGSQRRCSAGGLPYECHVLYRPRPRNHLRPEGVVTADDYLAHVQRLLADPDWPPARCQQLSDLRAASVTAIDEATLESAAALFGQHPKITTLKTALVAGESFKHAVKFERFLSRYRPALIVFNSLDIACTWLGIDAHEAARTLGLLRGQARGRMNEENSVLY